MAKNYIYRMDHDTGYAPNTDYEICTLCGCKITTVEKWATEGSWIIGIGGNGTGKPNKLIYAMEVEECLDYLSFKLKYPRKSDYLRNRMVEKILVSHNFYYFGDKAIDLPMELQHIIINRQGCKKVTEIDIDLLKRYLQEGNYPRGKNGKPNNPRVHRTKRKCHCVS